VLGQQINRAIGEGVALVAPAVPADIGVDVLGVEADFFKDADCLGQNLIADAVTRHAYDCVFGHISSL